MTTPHRLARILATHSGEDIELAFATQDGLTVKVLATPDQVDRLVDELEDILNSPSGPEAPEPPAAA